MSKIQQLTKLIQQHMPEERDALNQYLALKAAESALPTIAVYGVYSSGKSSLLNSLTEHIDAEYFATAVTPETRAIKTFEFKQVRYMDTPGLDVNTDDTHTAQAGAYQADLLIFTHNLKAGVVQKTDLEAFKKLAKEHQNDDAIIIALTHLEETDQDSELIGSVTQQFHSIVPKAKVFSVSNPSFIKGKREHKNGLVKYSGIVPLQQHIQSFAPQLSASLQKTRESKQQVLLTHLFEQLDFAHAKLELAMTREALKASDHEYELVDALHILQMELVAQDLSNLKSQLS